jgi:hypothetical protein
VLGERADPQLAIYAQGGVDLQPSGELQPALALSPAQPSTVVGESCFACCGKSEPLFHTFFERQYIYICEFIFFFWSSHIMLLSCSHSAVVFTSVLVLFCINCYCSVVYISNFRFPCLHFARSGSGSAGPRSRSGTGKMTQIRTDPDLQR